MQVKDLIVTGDARVLGKIYTSDGAVSGGASGGGSSGDGSGLTYTLSKSGSTITLTGSDGSTSSVTDANTDTNTTYSNATTSAAGLMSASDKSKLDGIATGANKYTHPSYTAKSNGLYKVTVDASGHVSGTAAVAKSDITALGIPAQDTTYSAATQSANGLMSAADKSKLDGIASGATKITVDSALSSSSTNPVQNKVINSALAGKANSSHTHDDRYYTETEVNNLLNGKANSSHTHGASDISSLASTIQSLINSGGISMVKSVQRGSSSLADGTSAATSTTVTISSVNTAKSILIVNSTSSLYPKSDNNYAIGVKGELTNGTTITFTKTDKRGAINFAWQVIELY